MSKSRVCVSTTINLAKKRCPQKISELVHDNTVKTCPPRCAQRLVPIQRVPIKRIQICTGAQLKRICQQAPCECPSKSKFCLTPACIVMFFFKSVFFGSLVFYTWDAGLWGDSEETEEIFTNFCRMFGSQKSKKEMFLNEGCEMELELLPSKPFPEDKCRKPPVDRSQALYMFKEMWNHAVIAVFSGIVGFPGNLTGMIPSDEDGCKK